MIFVFLSSRIKNTSVFVLIDLAGHTGVVLLCCEINIRKLGEKKCGGGEIELGEGFGRCEIKFHFVKKKKIKINIMIMKKRI